MRPGRFIKCLQVKQMKRVKTRVFKIISKGDARHGTSFIFDTVIVSTILLSVLSIILESFQSLALRYAAAFNAFEVFSIILFTLEYLARIWTADLLYPTSKHPRLRYLFSAMALVDLLAILPFYLPYVAVDLRFLRMLRLFKLSRLVLLFKLERYFSPLKTIAGVMKKEWPKLMMTLFASAVIILFSAILMYTVENQAQPKAFPNVIASLWWAVCTFTTVGYGDVYPITAAGKFFASVISLVGIGIVAIPTGIISAGFINATKKEDLPEDKKRFCPYCEHEIEK